MREGLAELFSGEDDARRVADSIGALGEPKARSVAASRTIFSKSMLPSDANPWGNVHGGEIMRLIDECAGAAAQRHARTRVVTARIDELSFLSPVYVGDLVTAMASVNEVGKTSMEVGVRVESENTLTGKVVHVASAYLVFVAIDTEGRPVGLPPLIAETDDERRRMDAAKQRRALRLERPRR